MKFNLKFLKRVDWVLIILPVILMVTGIAIIYSLSYYDNIKLFYNQIFYVVVGIIAMISFSILDYRHLKSWSFWIYVAGIFFLILVLILGKTSFGSTRWINLGFYDFQPSELFKVILTIYLSAFLSSKIQRLNFKDIFRIFIIVAIPTVLILLQPDLGTSVILVLIALSIFFSCKLNWKQILVFVLTVAIVLPVGWYTIHDYQRQRLLTFLNPTADPYGTGYNVTQSIITVGSGGVTGRGFGQGPQSQLNFLPVAHTDFVFAGFAEATGFVGGIIMVLIFLILIYRILYIAKKARDNFGSLLAMGIATMLFLQIVVNIGMNIGLMPVTGVPLPFVSYGGSSLLIVMISMGILQSIYYRHKKLSF